jgi:hypothetical protein
MSRTIVKKAFLKWSGLFISATIIMAVIGNSIIFEGAKLLFSQSVKFISDLNQSTDVYKRNVPLSSDYTDVDFVYEYRGKEVRFKGYINELSDGFYLVFTQQEVKDNTLFILSKVTFSQENMALFRDSVIAQLSQDTGLSEEEVSALIHPEIFYDHTQRIINDIPIVTFWLFIFMGLLWLSIRTTTRYLKLLAHQDIKLTSIWAQDSGKRFKNKERYILSSGLLQCGMNPVYVAYSDILLYEKDTQGITLKTKTLKFKIQASEQLYEEIVKKVVPDFVIKT